MSPISICIIAKNEESHIEECLKRLVPYHFEIIVVDTGSTDRTVELSKKYTEHIYHFDWVDDFSAARNFSISKASYDWILVVDCDEYLTKLDLAEINKIILDKQKPLGFIYRIEMFENGNPKTIPVDRLFNRKIYHYTGRIHEQITPINGVNTPFIQMQTFFEHFGYYNHDMLAEKFDRYIPLLQMELDEKGPNPYIFFQMGKSYYSMNRFEEAYEQFSKALAMDIDEHEYYLMNMVEVFGECLLKLNRYEEALGLEGVYDTFKGHADFLYLMGRIYVRNCMFDRAIDMFQEASKTESHTQEGVNSYLPYYSLGTIFEVQGDLTSAKKYYQLCGSQYLPALERLNALSGK